MANEKRGKVGCGGQEIMAALWGTRGRPETNQYARLCADRAESRENPQWVTLPEYSEPDQQSRKLTESPRTSAKWSNARKAQRVIE